MNGPLKGKLWEHTDLLRVGRLEALEVVIDDSSVSRYHAEVKATDRGWRVRDDEPLHNRAVRAAA